MSSIIMVYQNVPTSSTNSSNTTTPTTDPAMITKGWQPFWAALVVLTTLFTVRLSSIGNNMYGNQAQSLSATSDQQLTTHEAAAFGIGDLISSFTMSNTEVSPTGLCDNINKVYELIVSLSLVKKNLNTAEWKNACTCIVDDHCIDEFDRCNSICQQEYEELLSSCLELNKKDSDEFDFDGFDTCLKKYNGPNDVIKCVVPIYQDCTTARPHAHTYCDSTVTHPHREYCPSGKKCPNCGSKRCLCPMNRVDV